MRPKFLPKSKSITKHDRMNDIIKDALSDNGHLIVRYYEKDDPNKPCYWIIKDKEKIEKFRDHTISRYIDGNGDKTIDSLLFIEANTKHDIEVIISMLDINADYINDVE